MNKTSPLSRGVRTFLAVLAAQAVTWQGVDWATNWRPGATLVGLGVLTALLAGIAAVLLAFAGVTASTPLGKAFATFCQTVGAGLSLIGLNELTSAALVNAGHAIYTLVVGAISAAVLSLILNAAEQKAATNKLTQPA